MEVLVEIFSDRKFIVESVKISIEITNKSSRQTTTTTNYRSVS